ncbi:2-oxo acid dehydrogenase subunit E2 [Nakamurella lactea]|uniref:2-oxo acid dehydrogenase subunit E2 n=1 Tax=Nakamurella lactea TaxID=459515 RepID=UPI0004228F10|nr:2-oxo acid dehydrogenase subunit E2 [Nakamurella lactea]
MQEVFIPVTGMAPDDVVLAAILRGSGEPVAKGDVVASIETSKAELEIEAPIAGVLGPWLFDVGDLIAPGSTIVAVLEDGEKPPPTRTEPLPEPARTQQTAPVEPGAAPRVSPLDDGDGRPHRLSPRRRRELAETAAREPAAPAPHIPPPPPPPGTAAAPRAVTATATTAPASATPATAAPAGSRPGTDYRAAISAAVSRSWQEIPHFAVTREIDVAVLASTVQDLRIVLPKLTVTDLLIRAQALAFLEHEGRSDLGIGLAVATGRGVAIPVVGDVPGLDLPALVRARVAAVDRARSGLMSAADGTTPVSTLSNLGALGVDQFTAIVPYGQASILSVGRAADRPVVRDGAVVVGHTMFASLNVDHRVFDGADAAVILDRFARILGAPTLLTAPAALTHSTEGS